MNQQEKNETLAESLFTLDREIYSEDYVENAETILKRGCSPRKLEAIGSADAAIKLLAGIVFRSFNVVYSRNGAGDEFSLTAVLNCKRGSCLGISLVYIVLGEHLNLPVHGILYDQHIALQYLDNDRVLNVEPKLGGKVLEQFEARKFYGFPLSSPYGVPLSIKQLRAVVLANRAPIALKELGPEMALKDLDAAIKIFPDYATAWINKAVITFKMGQAREAQGILERARGFSPGDKTTGLIKTIQERFTSP